jgi:hypothetical protein
MTSKGLKRTCTFLARWAILAIMEAHQADAGIASGDLSSTFVGANLRGQDKSLREESPARL